MLQRLFKRKPSLAQPPDPTPATQEADRLIREGQLLEDQGDLNAALKLYLAAVQVAPRYPRAYMNAGGTLRQLEQWEEAERMHRKGVKYAPDHALARFNLGLSLIDLAKIEEAEDQLLTAARLNPDVVEVPIVLADLYEGLDRFEDAESQFAKALAITPPHPGAMFNFATFCLRRGRLDEASELFRKAKSIDRGLQDAESSMLFSLNFRTDLDPPTIAARHRSVAALISRSAAPRATTWANASEPERKLRVAYVSGDFRVHPVALFLQPVLQYHDLAVIETYCYSNHEEANALADSLKGKSEHWRNISTMNDVEVIDQIKRDGIDILVDLSGHTNRNRLSVFASHPAPVQITWLGYLNTTGLDAMDYRICDRHTDPPESAEALHTERLIRMPDSQWCYVPWCPAEKVAQPHPEQPEAMVFGSLNQVAKISNACLDVWFEILKAVPGARLVLLDVRPKARGLQLLRKAERSGIAPDRIALRGRESIARYYSSIGNIDISLDTFPYNGATTTFDALWMGVPVVALRGDRGVSRSSYSILKTLGTEDLIAESLDEYLKLNVRLALDHGWRADFRRTLRDRLEASPLMDGRGFVSALEERYREVWRRWCDRTRISA